MVSKALLTLFAVVSAVQAIGLHVHEVHHAPQPYSFGYTIKDKHGEQHRQETGDGHSGVKGSYGFTDDRGIHRQVNYVADKAGFRAQVKTNEPGTANQDPAAVNIVSSAHPYFGAGYHGGAGYGYAGKAPVAAGYGYPAVAAVGGHGAHGAGVPFGAGFGGHGYGVVKRYDSREHLGHY